MADLITITKPTGQAPEGHEAAMLEKAATLEAPAPEAAPRPAWLPEKFKTVEDMAAAYSELERKQGAAPAAAPAPAAATPPAAPATAEAQAAVEAKGLDFAALTNEFTASGKLSDQTYANLAAKGFDKAAVDTYIKGVTATSTEYENSVMAEVGGKDKYTEVTAWAKSNLSAEDIDAYNSAVSSGNAAQARLAVAGLAAKFTAAVGSEPSRMLSGRGDTGASTDVYESHAQVTADMRNPLYKKDPAFRAKVQSKLGRSKVF